MKPLGHKAYGSIPHLPGSRLGPGDYHISEGQARIATEKARDKHDLIIVQEKLDGSNVAIANLDGKIYALTRAGYEATTSPYLQHHYFAAWVGEHERKFQALLKDGERLCGEWLVMAHGTRYDLIHDPFVAFDLMIGKRRLPYMSFIARLSGFEIATPHCLNIGSPFPIEAALRGIEISGHRAIDPVEGVIYRVERKGEVDFLAKYVHHFKQDGKYFAESNNGVYTWNCDISRWVHIKIPDPR